MRERLCILYILTRNGNACKRVSVCVGVLMNNKK